jgi:hypothetical protein
MPNLCGSTTWLIASTTAGSDSTDKCVCSGRVKEVGGAQQWSGPGLRWALCWVVADAVEDFS